MGRKLDGQAAIHLGDPDVHALVGKRVHLPAHDVGLDREEDFRELVVGRGADGHLVRLGEVADVRLSAEDERSIARTDGKAGISFGIEAQSQANTLDVV